MPSFDIQIKVNLVEIKNAVDISNKEIKSRYDFKNTISKIEHEDNEIKIISEDKFKINQIYDVLKIRLSKRKVNLKFLERGEIIKSAGQSATEKILIKNGISKIDSKEIINIIKASKIKAQTSLQGDLVRITSSKKDNLQQIIQIIKEKKSDLPLSFDNFRD